MVAIVLAVIAVFAATGTIVLAVRIGHSGVTAVWSEDMASASQAPAGVSDKG